MKGLGGPWTTKKLAKVREYLVAYQNVMLNNSWARTVYIDAFSGSGAVMLRGATAPTDGSALQAIGLSRPFSEYHLIDKAKPLARLRKQVEERYHDRLERVRTHVGDVNEVLPVLLRSLTSKHRAVAFIDPYGMQLDWTTLQSIAACPKVDLWLLVPTGIGLQRVATKNRANMPSAWQKRVDRFLGDSSWREAWYAPSRQTKLFGDPPDTIKTATLETIDRDVQSRLRRIFPKGGVAENVLHLRDGTRVLYSLMFACSNPSPKAQAASMRIANALLKE